MDKKYKIPKYFYIGAKKIKILQVFEVFEKEKAEWNSAEAHLTEDIILIQKPKRNWYPTDAELEITVLHEVIHMILYNSLSKQYTDDENLVQALANGMYQFLKTVK